MPTFHAEITRIPTFFREITKMPTLYENVPYSYNISTNNDLSVGAHLFRIFVSTITFAGSPKFSAGKCTNI